MKIILSDEEFDRWTTLYKKTNPQGKREEWVKDLFNIIAVCLQACVIYRFEISHQIEEQEPVKTVAEISETVLDLLISKDMDDSLLDEHEEGKDYEEEYRLLLDDILTCFYIFTGKVDLSISPSERLIKQSTIQIEIDNGNFIIDISAKGASS